MTTHIFVGASVRVDLARLHELQPASDGALLDPEPAYMLCGDQVDGLCSAFLIVPARQLAPILFPEGA